MAFKSMEQYNTERYGNFFMLQDDGDSAQVIFLYRKLEDVLVAPVHYIASSDFKGYVHCLGDRCPACKPGPGRERGLRVQTKLFVPVYNIDADEIQYFDRSDAFYHQLCSDVFRIYENPSECVFRIVRHGAYRDRNTRYEIQLLGKNDIISYDEILSKFNTSMPEDYERVVKDMSASEMQSALDTYGSNSSESSYSSASDLPKYTPIPRVTVPTPAFSESSRPKIDVTSEGIEDEDVDEDVKF